jgi:hypothetical protein
MFSKSSAPGRGGRKSLRTNITSRYILIDEDICPEQEKLLVPRKMLDVP